MFLVRNSLADKDTGGSLSHNWLVETFGCQEHAQNVSESLLKSELLKKVHSTFHSNLVSPLGNSQHKSIVIPATPAKARGRPGNPGIVGAYGIRPLWIPASAGMTAGVINLSVELLGQDTGQQVRSRARSLCPSRLARLCGISMKKEDSDFYRSQLRR
jgi:hypothetical protein